MHYWRVLCWYFPRFGFWIKELVDETLRAGKVVDFHLGVRNAYRFSHALFLLRAGKKFDAQSADGNPLNRDDGV